MNTFESVTKSYACRNAATLAAIPAPVARPSGRIWIDTGRAGPMLFVSFPKGPDFQANLDKARAMKRPGVDPGWSNPDTAWVYTLTQVQTAVATFPGFTLCPRTAELVAKLGAGKPVDTAPPPVDGTITKSYSQVLIQWPERHPDFSRFLDAARRLKRDHGATYNGQVRGWYIDARHLPAVLRAFPTFRLDPNITPPARQPAYGPDDDRRQDMHPDTAGPDMGRIADDWLSSLS